MANISRFLCALALANIFIIKDSGVRLHNFATEHFINDETTNVFENREKVQRRACVLKTNMLAITFTGAISR